MHLVASVCLSVRPSVRPSVCNALLLEPILGVCVSLISGRMQIIARMRSIGVLIYINPGTPCGLPCTCHHHVINPLAPYI